MIKTSKEALEIIKDSLLPYDEGYLDEEEATALDFIENRLEVLEILEKHPLLNLKLLYDYECCNFDDYWEEYSGTTNELNEIEFKTLIKWQEKCKITEK